MWSVVLRNSGYMQLHTIRQSHSTLYYTVHTPQRMWSLCPLNPAWIKWMHYSRLLWFYDESEVKEQVWSLFIMHGTQRCLEMRWRPETLVWTQIVLSSNNPLFRRPWNWLGIHSWTHAPGQRTLLWAILSHRAPAWCAFELWTWATRQGWDGMGWAGLANSKVLWSWSSGIPY